MKQKSNRKSTLAVKEITLTGIMIAILEVSKLILFLPNVELVTFWIIMFTLFYGRKTIYAVLGFVFIEGFIYGFHTWWIMYLYIWPMLVLITWLLRKNNSVIIWSLLSAGFGLFFGAICSLPYIVIGTVDGGLMNGLYAAFTWWVAGIPWDMIHGVSNFFIMLVLYVPIRRVTEKIKNSYWGPPQIGTL